MIIKLNQKVCRHAIICPDKHVQETIFNEDVHSDFYKTLMQPIQCSKRIFASIVKGNKNGCSICEVPINDCSHCGASQ